MMTGLILMTGLKLTGCESGAAPGADPAKAAASAAPAASAQAPAAAASAPAAPGAIPAPTDVADAPADAQKTASGLASKVIQPGNGDKRPGPRDRVKVHYTGWTKDGKMFDSSVARGEPTEFALNQVIPGWTEGVQLMLPGEKRRFWIPAALAYGERPRPGAPSGQLTFDVELIEFKETPKPPEAPEDLTKPPASAQKSKSGLVSRVIKPGTGKDHPKPSDTVRVHYSGWTQDGKLFDSSIPRGSPASFRLDQVIKGWTEGVQLMVAGETRRFWIPGDLAYGDKPQRPGAPAGTLVFDVELLEIKTGS
jgi:FKBP-type peptidyl-prolyl cis-trans isomerase